MKTVRRGTRECALDLGVDEMALLRYASGAVSTYERQEIQNVLVRNEWAMNYVVRAVKDRRKQAQTRTAA
jgi:hypothetical protein